MRPSHTTVVGWALSQGRPHRRGVSSVPLIHEVMRLLTFSEPCLENKGDSCPWGRL